MGKDLGTYHVRVELTDGRGWIQEWTTSQRYTHGRNSISPLDADRIPPIYECEDDVINSVRYMYLEGNYDCDCNKTMFWCDSQQIDEPEDIPCGDEMTIKRLTLITPTNEEIEIGLD